MMHPAINPAWLAVTDMRGVIEMARNVAREPLANLCKATAQIHLAYAAKTNSPQASRIASECGQRCELFCDVLDHNAPLDLSELASRVELFNLACKVLAIQAVYRDHIAAGERP